MHCNDNHFFKPDQIDWKRLICSAFNQNGQIWKKWSFWVKIVVIAMQCNAILMKVTSLMRIDPCQSMWNDNCIYYILSLMLLVCYTNLNEILMSFICKSKVIPKGALYIYTWWCLFFQCRQYFKLKTAFSIHFFYQKERTLVQSLCKKLLHHTWWI